MHIHRVESDGECLFNAIAYGILYYINNHIPKVKDYKTLAKHLRSYVVNYYESKLKNDSVLLHLAILYGEVRNKNINIENKDLIYKYAKKYISHMKKECSWGGVYEINVLNRLIKYLGFQGIVILDDSFEIIHGMKMKLNKKKKHHITLILHGVKIGGYHFDFVSYDNISKIF